jgi:type VI secretion system protein ImpE
MPDAHDLLAAGEIDAARQALIETLRAAPQDERARMFLFQLLCVMGEWEKALIHLRTLAQLNTEAPMLSVVYGQAIAAEQVRAAAFAGAGAFPLLVDSSSWMRTLAQSLEAVSRGDPTGASELRQQAFEDAADTPGTWDEHRFETIADVDARLGPAFEAIIMGRWGLIPFEAIREIKSEGPKDLRDMVWLPVEVALRSGSSVAAFLPVRYPGSERSSDAGIRLARRTDWVEGQRGEEGLGQRQWFVDDGTEFGILSLRRLAFD